MVGQSCRFAVTSTMTSEAMPAHARQKHRYRSFLLDQGCAAALPQLSGQFAGCPSILTFTKGLYFRSFSPFLAFFDGGRG
jgi:hypothetical protein